VYHPGRWAIQGIFPGQAGKMSDLPDAGSSLGDRIEKFRNKNAVSSKKLNLPVFPTFAHPYDIPSDLSLVSLREPSVYSPTRYVVFALIHRTEKMEAMCNFFVTLGLVSYIF
jgi:hypothetical protein